MKMKRIMILVSALALVMVFAASAPAMACTPTLKHGTFTWYGIGVGTGPPTVTVGSNGVVHITSTGQLAFFGGSWGTVQNQYDGSYTHGAIITDTNYITQPPTGSGSVVSFGVSTYPGAGVAKGVLFLTLLPGTGSFVYNGPTIEAFGITVTHGTTYVGGLDSGAGWSSGISGTLTGVNLITESSKGVAITNSAGVILYDINVETISYWCS
ncbi:MAG: hypothetical protein ABSE15_04250 [Candidatus Bathyarchaeia archaeon]